MGRRGRQEQNWGVDFFRSSGKKNKRVLSQLLIKFDFLILIKFERIRKLENFFCFDKI